jgi:acetyl esterase/lipase
MAIRCVLVEGALDLAIDGVDVRVASSPLDLGGQAPREVLVVSADEELLAEAGRLGAHRLSAAGPEVTAAAALELCRELDRPGPPRLGIGNDTGEPPADSA